MKKRILNEYATAFWIMLTFPLYSWFYISYFIFSFLCLKGIYLPLFYFECYNSYCLTPCYLKDIIIKIKWKYKNNELILISNEISICRKSAPIVDSAPSPPPHFITADLFWDFFSKMLTLPYLSCYYIHSPPQQKTMWSHIVDVMI